MEAAQGDPRLAWGGFGPPRPHTRVAWRQGRARLARVARGAAPAGTAASIRAARRGFFAAPFGVERGTQRSTPRGARARAQVTAEEARERTCRRGSMTSVEYLSWWSENSPWFVGYCSCFSKLLLCRHRHVESPSSNVAAAALPQARLADPSLDGRSAALLAWDGPLRDAVAVDLPTPPYTYCLPPTAAAPYCVCPRAHATSICTVPWSLLFFSGITTQLGPPFLANTRGSLM